MGIILTQISEYRISELTSTVHTVMNPNNR